MNVDGLLHFASVLGYKTCTLEVVTTLYNGGALRKPSDYYTMTQGQMWACGVDRSDTPALYEEVRYGKGAYFAHTLLALNIPLFSHAGIARLLSRFPDWAALQKATKAELTAIPNLGASRVKSFLDWRKGEGGKEAALVFKARPPLPPISPVLSGFTVTLEGKLKQSRRQMIDLIYAHGGVYQPEVTKIVADVQIIVAHRLTGLSAKTIQGIELGARLIDEASFVEMLREC